MPEYQARAEKCMGVDADINDNKLPKATKMQCAGMCIQPKRRRRYDIPGQRFMNETQYIEHLEERRDSPNTNNVEKKQLDNQIWNRKQQVCKQKKLYKEQCSKFDKQQEKSQLDKLLPFAIGGLVIFILLD